MNKTAQGKRRTALNSAAEIRYVSKKGQHRAGLVQKGMGGGGWGWGSEIKGFVNQK